MSQNNAKQQVVSKSAKRRQRQRKRAIGTGVQPATKSVQQPRQPNQNQRARPRRNRGRGPMASTWSTRTRGIGGVFQTTDPFGSGWEEKSGMLGVGNTRGIRTTKRDMVIEESEFIGAVTVANQPNFNVKAFPINPGQSATFPWLSTIAKQFERFQFEALSFVFKKEVSEFNTAGAAGKVIMSIDFDAGDAPPATKQQMEDSIPHADAMPSQSFSLPVHPSDLSAQNTLGRYVRTGGLPGAADIKTYDVGNLFVATQGIPSNVEIGELHVAYRVRLIKPVLENLVGAPANNQVSVFADASAQAIVSNTPIDLPVATVITNGLVIVNTAGSMVPPPGNYLLDYTLQAADSIAEQLVVTADFRKNGASIFGASIEIPTSAFDSGAGNVKSTLTGTMFVTANGTDAFTCHPTLIGAAGTLTAAGLVRWTSV